MEDMTKEELSEFNQESMRFGLLMHLIFWTGISIVLTLLYLTAKIIYAFLFLL